MSFKILVLSLKSIERFYLKFQLKADGFTSMYLNLRELKVELIGGKFEHCLFVQSNQDLIKVLKVLAIN